jgi:hypothetical protein
MMELQDTLTHIGNACAHIHLSRESHIRTAQQGEERQTSV